MQDFLIALLICSITMSVLALLYIAASPFLTKHYSAKGGYYVWLIIVLGFIIPFRPQWSNAFINVEIPMNASSAVLIMSEEESQIAPPVQALPPLDDIALYNTATLYNATSVYNTAMLYDTAMFYNTATLYNTASIIAWWQIGFAIWAAGVIIFLAFHAIKHYRFCKTMRRWSKNITDERILLLLEDIKSEMGITRSIQVHLCTFAGSPMMVGLFKPQILLPTLEMTQDETRFILKHELVHYKRKDLLYKYLVMAATALHWFNPIIYMIAKAINVLCETSCDAEVLQNADESTRQSYGETIIGIVQYHSRLKTAYSTNFYGGKNIMKTRISSIMDTGKKKTGVVILTLVLVATLCTGVLLVVSAEGNAIPEQAPYIIPDTEYSHESEYSRQISLQREWTRSELWESCNHGADCCKRAVPEVWALFHCYDSGYDVDAMIDWLSEQEHNYLLRNHPPFVEISCQLYTIGVSNQSRSIDRMEEQYVFICDDGYEWEFIDRRLCEHKTYGLDILYERIATDGTVVSKWLCRGSDRLSDFVSNGVCCNDDALQAFYELMDDLSTRMLPCPRGCNINHPTSTTRELRGWQSMPHTQRICVDGFRYGFDVQGFITFRTELRCPNCRELISFNDWNSYSWRCFGRNTL